MDRAPDREHTLNVDPFVQLRLLDLQALDTRLDQVAHRRKTLPEAARVAALDGELASTYDRVVAARTVAEDLQREQAKAEADVEQVRERARRDQELLDGGSVGNAKQLESLRQELQSLARRQSDLEDVELEVMERLEGAEAALAQLRGQHDALSAERETVLAARDAAYADLDAERDRVAAERDGIASDLPADLLALYEKLRADHAGVGAAALYRGRCEGCRIELTPSDIARIRESLPTEVLRCEECRRILVRTAESGL